MNDNTINDAVRCESGAVFEDLATEDELGLLGGDASCSCDLGAQIIDERGVGGGEGDREGFSGSFFDSDGDAHGGARELTLLR